MSSTSESNLESIELAQIPLPTSSSTLYLNPPVSAALPSDSFSNVNNVPSINRNQLFLPPVDKGFGAWSFLTAAFFVQAIVWGFPTLLGVFLDAEGIEFASYDWSNLNWYHLL
ncbi:hypothetical protein EV368DRAFT_86248 [Lentinula lateritia]|uniref:Uncharacterized protein n=1 Tax=Lentinula aff. lateritia TaxID=2804960 RepID=A0ACC1TVR5_9AGAR|nr:hypothetical protein F5876DRAFT_78558 [Lentinula aff. lateritia]KAJ3848770.1 hypothetical protein EV368DRAFT_86248 [Lentinula lateritia]